VDLLRAAMTEQRVAASQVSREEQHTQLRSEAFASRANYKALQYLKLRELPKIGARLAPSAVSQREYSILYKR